MEKILTKILDWSVDIIIKLGISLIIILIGFKLIKFLMKKVQKGKMFQRLEKSSQTFLISIINIGLKILVMIIAVTTIGIPMTSIITIIGSAGLALGLALQGGLSNIAGGVMIMIFKPFKVGDFIDTHIDSGTVKEINIFHTKLSTVDNKIIVLPNGQLSNSTIINYSAMKERMLDLEIAVSYDTSISKVKTILTNIAKENPYVILEKDIVVALKEQGSDALIFAFRTWVKTSDYTNAKFLILETIKEKFDKENINIPYKQLDVHLIK